MIVCVCISGVGWNSESEEDILDKHPSKTNKIYRELLMKKDELISNIHL